MFASSKSTVVGGNSVLLEMKLPCDPILSVAQLVGLSVCVIIFLKGWKFHAPSEHLFFTGYVLV